MRERRSHISEPTTTEPLGSKALRTVELSPMLASESRVDNRVTYRSPHMPEAIRYIDNPAFHQPDAWKAIVEAPSHGVAKSASKFSRNQNDDLAPLLAYPTLPTQETTRMFLKMNFLKFQAVQELLSLGEQKPSPEQFASITNLLSAAKEVKDLLVLSNARLTVMAAQSFIRNSLTRDDLVSIGLESLMRTTELFDCSKGFSFTTYASVALRGVYARASGVAKGRELSSISNEECTIDPTDERNASALSDMNHVYLQNELSAAIGQLAPRDQEVLTHRILNEGTLEEVGERIGITKEGARLAVLRALKRLRAVLPCDPRDNLL